tara:strand:- start:567 stop:704 length:138 start_codon:yes stop_codon:yes gene_type:complete
MADRDSGRSMAMDGSAGAVFSVMDEAKEQRIAGGAMSAISISVDR